MLLRRPKSFRVLAAFIGLAVFMVTASIIACDFSPPFPAADDNNANDDGIPEDPTEPEIPTLPEPGYLTDSEYWGYWIKSDTFDQWYINDKTVIVGLAEDAISGFVAASGVFQAGGRNFTRKSANILEVNTGEFFLYRKAGAKSRLDGKIVAAAVPSSVGKALGLAGIGSIKLIVRNLKNPTNAKLIDPNADGSFDMGNIISQDSYSVATIIANGTEVKAGPAFTVTPSSGVNDIGTITLAPKEGTFKLSCSRLDLPWAYVQDGGYYSFYPYHIVIQNVGMTTAHDLTLYMEPENGLEAVFHADIVYPVQLDGGRPIGLLGGTGSLPEKRVDIEVRCSVIESDMAYKSIALSLRDASGEVWNDSVNLKFYRRETRIRFASVGGPVYGHVFSPEEDGSYFSTHHVGGDRYETVVQFPAMARGYTILVAKMAGSTSAAYSFGVDDDAAVEPADDAAILAGDGIDREPNDGEDQAWPFAFGEVIIDYLDTIDVVDFYDIGAKTAMPEISMPAGSYNEAIEIALSCYTAGADIYYTLDGAAPDMDTNTGTKYSGPFTLDCSANFKARAFKRYPVNTLNSLADSNIAAANYTFVCSPIILTENTDVGSWSAATESNGAAIRFTRDGSEPANATAGFAYDPLNPPKPIQGEILTFRAFKDGWTSSAAVVNRGPFGDFAISKLLVSPGESVAFDAAATADPTTSADEIQLSWSFGDGTAADWSTEKTAAHTYTAGGLKTVTLYAKNRYGMISATSEKLLVLATGLSGFELVFVPGGIFQMGESPVWNSNGPSHQTRLSAYYIQKYEITQDQWDNYMTIPLSAMKRLGNDIPIHAVSWYSAVEYCNRLSIAEGLEPVYTYTGFGTNPATWPSGWIASDHNNIVCDWTRVGYRLPTEAEWEYAAGGAVSGRQFDYSGSASYADVGWYDGNSATGEPTGVMKPQPVGQKAPNALGLYDMSGNVYEWCWDWSTNYSATTQVNPTGPATPVANFYQRIHRGGGWEDFFLTMRVFHRDDNYPSSTSYYQGLRPVLGISGLYGL